MSYKTNQTSPREHDPSPSVGGRGNALGKYLFATSWYGHAAQKVTTPLRISKLHRIDPYFPLRGPAYHEERLFSTQTRGNS